MPAALSEAALRRLLRPKSMALIGEIEGKNVLLVDDLTETAGTLTAAAALLTYETFFFPFLAAPLLLLSWKEFSWRRLLGHGAICGAILVLVILIRRSRGDGRISETLGSLREVTDNMPALGSRRDTEQRFRFANRAYGDWLQLDPASLLGRSLAEADKDEAAEAAMGIGTQQRLSDHENRARHQ